MTNPKLQRLVVKWAQNKRFWLLHLAPPCSGWSVARNQQLSAPPTARSLALFTVRLIRACRSSGTAFTVENPAGSRLWDWPPLRRELIKAKSLIVPSVFCAFGAPYRKPTSWASSLGAFSGLWSQCSCRGLHRERLQGLVHHKGEWKWKSSLASPYPPAAARCYAQCALAAAPASAWRQKGEPLVDDKWQQHLASEINIAEFTRVACPPCPVAFRLPWANCKRKLEPQRSRPQAR